MSKTRWRGFTEASLANPVLAVINIFESKSESSQGKIAAKSREV
jgi:hypothetical protein